MIEKKDMIGSPERLTSETKKWEKEEENKKKSRTPWFVSEFDGLHCFETLVFH